MQRLNYAYITLAPKKDGVSDICDFRPISLIHGVYKILMKVLATQLATKINQLINPLQSAFIKTRSIMDSVVLAQETVTTCSNNQWSALFLGLNFTKTFDSLEWEFIMQALWARGFGDRWCSWIKSALESGTSSILINNTPGPHIKCKQDLRQGDPIPPYLFELATNAFTKIIQKASDMGFIQQVGHLHAPVGLTSLQYADDTLLLLPTNATSFHNFKIILYCFE